MSRLPSPLLPPDPTVTARERAALAGLLARHAGNVAAVGRELGRGRGWVYAALARLGLSGDAASYPRAGRQPRAGAGAGGKGGKARASKKSTGP